MELDSSGVLGVDYEGMLRRKNCLVHRTSGAGTPCGQVMVS